MTEKKDRGAVLQFEIDRQRMRQYSGDPGLEGPVRRVRSLAETAVIDTLVNGGTFVLVVSETKITMVQRPDAEELAP